MFNKSQSLCTPSVVNIPLALPLWSQPHSEPETACVVVRNFNDKVPLKATNFPTVIVRVLEFFAGAVPAPQEHGPTRGAQAKV
jgi:hypothetical protein